MIDMWFPAGRTSHIAVFDNAVDVESCKTIERFGFLNWDKVLRQGETVDGVYTHIKDSWDYPLIPHVIEERYGSVPNYLLAADQLVHSGLTMCLAMYEQEYEFLNNKNGWVDSGYNVQYYLKGLGHYVRHVDGDHINERKRILAFIVYLNDVEQGGETRFPDHDVDVQPVTGRVVIFPTSWTHPHIAKMPISNHKAIISSFVFVNEG
jgi:hypothetical protein